MYIQILRRAFFEADTDRVLIWNWHKTYTFAVNSQKMYAQAGAANAPAFLFEHRAQTHGIFSGKLWQNFWLGTVQQHITKREEVEKDQAIKQPIARFAAQDHPAQPTKIPALHPEWSEAGFDAVAIAAFRRILAFVAFFRLPDALAHFLCIGKEIILPRQSKQKKLSHMKRISATGRAASCARPIMVSILARAL